MRRCGAARNRLNEGVVEVAVLAFPFNPSVVSSPEFVGGVEGETETEGQ